MDKIQWLDETCPICGKKVIREEKEKKLKKALFGKRKPKEVQISFDDL